MPIRDVWATAGTSLLCVLKQTPPSSTASSGVCQQIYHRVAFSVSTTLRQGLANQGLGLPKIHWIEG